MKLIGVQKLCAFYVQIMNRSQVDAHFSNLFNYLPKPSLDSRLLSVGAGRTDWSTIANRKSLTLQTPADSFDAPVK